MCLTRSFIPSYLMLATLVFGDGQRRCAFDTNIVITVITYSHTHTHTLGGCL